MTRGNTTRGRLIEFGARYVRERGFTSLSVRAIAEECSVTHGAFQHHFRTHSQFVKEVLRFCRDDVSQRLERSIAGVRGLAATLVLVQEWLETPELRWVLAEVVRPVDPRSGHDPIRAQMIETLEAWLELTQRTLHQARARNELREGTDARRVAVDLHHALWSFGWTAELYGERTARRGVLEAVWGRLSAIALDPAASLPHHDEFVGAGTLTPGADGDDIADGFVPKDRWGDPPVWFVVMPRVDPLFHTFMRHAQMGQMHSILAPPPVLPEDVTAAEEYARRHPDEVAKWGPPGKFKRTTQASPEPADPRG